MAERRVRRTETVVFLRWGQSWDLGLGPFNGKGSIFYILLSVIMLFIKCAVLFFFFPAIDAKATALPHIATAS